MNQISYVLHLLYLDIDECDSNMCLNEATCNNTEGSFTCACSSGYDGDGINSCDGGYLYNRGYMHVKQMLANV